MRSRNIAAEERSEQRTNELEQKMEQMMKQNVEQMKTEMGRVNKQSNEWLERMLKDSVKRLEKELEDTKQELKDTKQELKDTKQELKDTKQELKDTKAELAKEKEITRNLQSSLSALMRTQATLNKIRLRILLDYARQFVLKIHGLSNSSWDEATRNLDEDAIVDFIRSASVKASRPLQNKSID
ncbi:hypothetical protein HETIRDRAFT_478089 [Heterobasidion irregulare TC 32-1]|uniref:Uncharacterized protein n=1 Tax=Heterobasidion irregulare (strain TC 32-1) TaxID=747525 RepID=W4JZ10_HETIT|nr:uncharacterized protein HETIRDRAFT_478089 [Heterobasidion irregulare TC 32-1]ETW78798.1 hypothetical protein HETIRDRAFT_478089 [Heterobasidion irregulare TC 32-1]